MLLSLRDDFLIRCSEHEPLAPVFESLTPLPALTADGLRRALVEPAKKLGYRFEDEALVAEMIESVEGARGALPLLAFAVARLWEKRDRERKLLTRAAYEEIGAWPAPSPSTRKPRWTASGPSGRRSCARSSGTW